MFESTRRAFETLMWSIERFSRFRGPVIVAIDGMCASGKSTLAAALAEHFDAGLFHADDYFLPPEMRTPERLGTPGGNMHRERLLEEVILPLRRNEPPITRRFDCGTLELLPPEEQPLRRINFIEGSYTMHPELREYYNLTAALRITPEEQLRRLGVRAPEKLEAFRTRWIPLENAYFDAAGVYDAADFVFDM